MKAWFEYTPLQFKRPAGTSRGVLTVKHSWLIHIEDNGIEGIGECSIIPDLSPDYQGNDSYESLLDQTINQINSGELTAKNCHELLRDFPSILFGVECAFLDLQNGGKRVYFDNAFANGTKQIPINGLIWMGDKNFMSQQIEEKLNTGFTTIKMKIGAIDFDTEFTLLQQIRSNFSPETITLRVDANGAFSPEQAVDVLQKLAELSIHSIEQPIKAKQWNAMRDLCRSTPTPIALDEELIGVNTITEKQELLDTIQPQYIILKPSLHGGISGCKEWIELAENREIDWWMTSALESNIGLKAICQFTAEFNNPLPQGLGTGSLYETNFPTDLVVKQGHIYQEKK